MTTYWTKGLEGAAAASVAMVRIESRRAGARRCGRDERMWTARQVRRFATALKRAACAIVVCPSLGCIRKPKMPKFWRTTRHFDMSSEKEEACEEVLLTAAISKCLRRHCGDGGDMFDFAVESILADVQARWCARARDEALAGGAAPSKTASSNRSTMTMKMRTRASWL